MPSELTEAHWKANGQKHVPLLGKTKIPDALKLWAKADKLPPNPAGVDGREKALIAILKAVVDAQAAYDKGKHPKLNAALEKLKLAVKSEKDEWNRMVAGLTFEHAMSDALFGRALRTYCAGERASENIDFLTALGKGEDPRAIYEKYIVDGAPSEINIRSDIKAPLHEAYGQNKKLDFTKAAKIIADNTRAGAFDRFKATLQLKKPA